MELYPIRIDVLYPPIPLAKTTSSSVIAPTSSDVAHISSSTTTTPPMIRIIDTLMIDPKSLLDNDLEKQNVVFTQWAHSIISDAFVVGITKVQKSNTSTTTLHPNNKNTSSTDTNVPNTAASASGNDRRIEFTGRYSLIDITTTTSTTNIATAKSIHDTIGMYDSLMQQAIHQIQTQFCTIQQYERFIRHNHQQKMNTTTRGTRNTFNATSLLIPIQLRLEIPSSSDNQIPPIRYHDDFLWDPLHPSLLSPLQMAQSIVNDLHLSRDTIPIITIHILEQTILFLTTTTITGDHTNDVNDVDMDDDDEGIKMGPPILLPLPQDNAPTTKATAAWEISHAIHHTNMIHMETLQKQQVTTTTITK